MNAEPSGSACVTDNSQQDELAETNGIGSSGDVLQSHCALGEQSLVHEEEASSARKRRIPKPSGTQAIFSCGHCSQSYGRSEHLKRHVASRHSNAEPIYQCNVCLRRYNRSDILTRHKKEHCLKVPDAEIDNNGTPKRRRLGVAIARTQHAETEEESQLEVSLRAKACRPCAESKVQCKDAHPGPCSRCQRNSVQCRPQLAKPRKPRLRRGPAKAEPALASLLPSVSTSPEAHTFASTSPFYRTPGPPSLPSGLRRSSSFLGDAVFQSTSRSLSVSSASRAVSSKDEALQGEAFRISSRTASVNLRSATRVTFADLPHFGSFDNTPCNGLQMESLECNRVESEGDASHLSGAEALFSFARQAAEKLPLASPIRLYDSDHRPGVFALPHLTGSQTPTNTQESTATSATRCGMRLEAHEAPTFISVLPHPITDEHDIEHLLNVYFVRFDPIFPILHQPTFDRNSAEPVLVKIMASIAVYMLGDMQRGLQMRIEVLSHLQSIQMSYRLAKNPLPHSKSFHQARLLADFPNFGDCALPPPLELEDFVLQWAAVKHLTPQQTASFTPVECWKAWVAVEEARRLALGYIYLYCFHSSVIPIFSAEEVQRLAECVYDVPMPQSVARWSALTAVEWVNVPSESILESDFHAGDIIHGTRTGETAAMLVARYPFSATTIYLASDILAGEDKHKLSSDRDFNGPTQHLGNYENAVVLYDRCLQSPLPANLPSCTSSELSIRLLHHLEKISYNMPLANLWYFTNCYERFCSEAKTLVKNYLQIGRWNRGREVAWRGAQIWYLVSRMTAEQLEDAVMAPFALFYATCALCAYALLVDPEYESEERVSVKGSSAVMAGGLAKPSPGEETSNTQILYLDIAAGQALRPEVEKWLKGEGRYRLCLSLPFLTDSGLLSRKENLEALVFKATDMLERTTFLQAQAKPLAGFLRNFGGIIQDKEGDRKTY